MSALTLAALWYFRGIHGDMEALESTSAVPRTCCAGMWLTCWATTRPMRVMWCSSLPFVTIHALWSAVILQAVLAFFAAFALAHHGALLR